jgi:hypothetical protein
MYETAKRIVDQLWKGFTCSGNTTSIPVTVSSDDKSQLDKIVNQLETLRSQNSTFNTLAKAAFRAVVAPQVASKENTITFLNTLKEKGTVSVTCKEAKLLALRIIILFDLNPPEYSGEKDEKHESANSRKRIRNSRYGGIAASYGVNTNILENFLHKYAKDKKIYADDVEKALKNSKNYNSGQGPTLGARFDNNIQKAQKNAKEYRKKLREETSEVPYMYLM